MNRRRPDGAPCAGDRFAFGSRGAYPWTVVRARGDCRLLRYAALEAAALCIRTPFLTGRQEHERRFPPLAFTPLAHARVASKPSERVLKTLDRLVGPAIHRSILPGV